MRFGGEVFRAECFEFKLWAFYCTPSSVIIEENVFFVVHFPFLSFVEELSSILIYRVFENSGLFVFELK